MPPIAVLLSGGVDSSVALALLAEGGEDVVAVYLKVWLEDELAHLGECPWEEDLAVARAVCGQLGVPLRVVSLQRRYHELVVAAAIGELRAGRTPSPDILCNRRIKFEAAVDALRAEGLEIAETASGHYARLRRTDGGAGPVELLRGRDPVKDQTYFLHRLGQERLRSVRFPIGGLAKAEVRRLAAERDLPNRDRPDSQGICFLGRISFTDFVRAHLGERPGPIVDEATGEHLGEHRGHWFHTIGQRRGLGLSRGPWYVVGKDVGRDEVVVAHADRPRPRHRDRLELDDCHWIAGAPPDPGDDLEVRIRHAPRTTPARIEVAAERPMSATVRLAEPEEGVAPGQAAVLYRGEVCLGGGWIRQAG